MSPIKLQTLNRIGGLTMSMDGCYCMRCGKVHISGICTVQEIAAVNDPREELRARLARHRRAIRRIEVVWNASDGGPRMTVTFKDSGGRQIDQWEDWMILGSENRPGTLIINSIIRNVLGQTAIEACDAGFYHRYYIIR